MIRYGENFMYICIQISIKLTPSSFLVLTSLREPSAIVNTLRCKKRRTRERLVN